MRDNGTYEFLVMLATTGLGFVGAPWWVAIMAATLLMLSTLEEYGHLQPRLMRAGGARLMGGALLATAVTSLAFAALAFAGGRCFAWLIAG